MFEVFIWQRKNRLKLVSVFFESKVLLNKLYILDLPESWDKICVESHFPKNFEIWSYFFQHMFTERCKILISQKIIRINEDTYNNLRQLLESISTTKNPEVILRNGIWIEEANDLRTSENKYYNGE